MTIRHDAMEDEQTQGELAFERELIEYLRNLAGVRQWEYLPEVKTTEKLWANFKSILEANNRGKLDEPYLSTTEFNQVKKVISELDTPYKAGQFLYGVNGVSEVEVDLDSGRHVFLTVFDQALVGTGGTVYQVVNQVERPRVVDGRPNRRFDVTLLINGLPIVQIELKDVHHNVDEAFEQMKQYSMERQYSDIYSTVQILVGMTKYSAKYMANPGADEWNKDFIFYWQNEEDSKRVTGWKEFADKVLAIPAAHNLATRYMILDGTPNNEAIKVMRPYQVYATKRVLDKVENFTKGDDGRLGYIWHTTGSGKTITSFKTAWLASRMPNIDKVVFLVDRIALTNQTVEHYRAYDPASSYGKADGVVSDTANVSDLRRKLIRKSDSNIIVTSVQKMARYVKRKDFRKPVGQILFIVDEAHRSTGDGMQANDGKTNGMLEDIRAAIPEAAWVGYTGTPRVDTVRNPSDRTKVKVQRNVTEEVFGSQLHAYTIRQAIADKNVLGFNVEFKDTIPDERPKLPTGDEWDDNVTASVYDKSEKHLNEVVDDIYSNWATRSKNYAYNALLTVHVGGGGSSTPRAYQYFEAFRAKNEERERENEQRKTCGKNPLPLLKVALTFSLDSSNAEGMTEKNANLLNAINHYNDVFYGGAQKFGLDNVKEYTDDVASRLNKTAYDGNFLDLVIVVDQFLTGFDAKQLNTLYVDRTLKGANLIQAYSRTNRVFNMQNKKHGLVVNYRWPEQNEREMNEALALYANREALTVDMSLTDLQDMNRKSGVLAPDFAEVQEELCTVLDKLREMTEDFTRPPASERAQEDALKLMNEYASLRSQLMEFTEDSEGEPFSANNPEHIAQFFDIGEREEIAIKSLSRQLRQAKANRDGVDVSQLELELVTVNNVEVNYDYLTDLLADMADARHEGDVETVELKFEEFKFEVDKVEDDRERESWHDFGGKIKDGALEPPVPYPAPRDVATMRVLRDADARKTRTETIRDFAVLWGVIDAIKVSELEKWFARHSVGNRDDLDKRGELSDLMLAAKNDYSALATSEEVQGMSWPKFRGAFREALYELADDIVKGA